MISISDLLGRISKSKIPVVTDALSHPNAHPSLSTHLGIVHCIGRILLGLRVSTELLPPRTGLNTAHDSASHSNKSSLTHPRMALKIQQTRCILSVNQHH